MKILVADIETRPNLAYVWELWNENVGLKALVESKQMICFSAKWRGAVQTEFWSVAQAGGEKAMVDRAWQFLDEADAVVHYNGKRFDIPYLNRCFLQNDLVPPAPYKQIDLLETVKRKFAFPSNKLAYVVRELGLGAKLETGGFDLWLQCMAGDATAWATMESYNRQDVAVTERLYEKLLPWINGHPSNSPMSDSGEDVCPTCGNTEFLAREGFEYTQTGKYQRYRCARERGGCGRWSRETRRISGSRIVQVSA